MTRSRRRGRGGGRGRGRGGGGGVHKPRRRAPPTAEELDYQMELLKAQREGREEEFKAEQAAKRREKKKKSLDDEMDAYFASKHAPPATDAEAAKATDKTPEKAREGATEDKAKVKGKDVSLKDAKAKSKDNGQSSK